MNHYHPFRSQVAKERYLYHYDKQASLWPPPSESFMVKTTYGDTFVRVCGAEHSSTIVLLHGDTENSLSWLPQIKTLSAHFRVIAIDHIYDNGRSIYTKPMKTLHDHIAWLDDLFSALRLKTFSLVGFSFGGWLATMYTLHRPKHIAKTVLISPSSTVIPPPISYLIPSISAHVIPTQYFIRRLVKWERNGLLALEEEGMKIIDDMVESLVLAGKCFKKRSFVMPTVLSDAQWQSIEVPILYMIGENEVICDANKAVRHLQTVNPAIKTMIVEDVSHDIAITKADFVNNKIIDFLTID